MMNSVSLSPFPMFLSSLPVRMQGFPSALENGAMAVLLFHGLSKILSFLVILNLGFGFSAMLSKKEGQDVMTDAEGRWFSFNISLMEYIILEKKGLPPHLASIENLDKPVSLQSLLTDLEDQGEVAWRVHKSSKEVLFNCQYAYH